MRGSFKVKVEILHLLHINILIFGTHLLTCQWQQATMQGASLITRSNLGFSAFPTELWVKPPTL